MAAFGLNQWYSTTTTNTGNWGININPNVGTAADYQPRYNWQNIEIKDMSQGIKLHDTDEQWLNKRVEEICELGYS